MTRRSIRTPTEKSLAGHTNGIYKLMNQSIKIHSPSQKPHKYRPVAQCPYIAGGIWNHFIISNIWHYFFFYIYQFSLIILYVVEYLKLIIAICQMS